MAFCGQTGVMPSSFEPFSGRFRIWLGVWSSLVVLGACQRPEPAEWGQDFDWGPVQSCPDSAVEGFDRFEEKGSELGVDLVLEGQTEAGPCGYVPGNVVAQDIDADGDIDLLYNQRTQAPALYLNDGQGQFTAVETVLPGLVEDRPIYAMALMDITGDEWPELWATGVGMAMWSENHGNLDFGDWNFVYWEDSYPMDCHPSLSLGDLDGDGDLDLVLPGLDEVTSSDSLMGDDFSEWRPTYDRLFINQDREFELIAMLSPEPDTPGFSLVQAFTDRDRDGDMDLLSGTDRPANDGEVYFPPQAFHRNDGLDSNGLPILVNDAPELSADVNVSAMGLGIQDLNGDGLLDYCMSDVATVLTCLLSTPDGPYYEAGAALGLIPTIADHPELPEDWDERTDSHGDSVWVSWGLAMVDLDNDGFVDLAASAGPPPDDGTIYLSNVHDFQPDWIWKGTPNGFEEAAVETGFHSLQLNYGLVTADLKGDGHRELILGPYEGSPQIWDNPCGPGAWLEVELVGSRDNGEAFGAMVIVEVDGREHIQEMHNLHAAGQSVSRLHFGLGDADVVDQITVIWKDGMESKAVDVDTRRLVTVTHPDR